MSPSRLHRFPGQCCCRAAGRVAGKRAPSFVVAGRAFCLSRRGLGRHIKDRSTESKVLRARAHRPRPARKSQVNKPKASGASRRVVSPSASEGGRKKAQPEAAAGVSTQAPRPCSGGDESGGGPSNGPQPKGNNDKIRSNARVGPRPTPHGTTNPSASFLGHGGRHRWGGGPAPTWIGRLVCVAPCGREGRLRILDRRIRPASSRKYERGRWIDRSSVLRSLGAAFCSMGSPRGSTHRSN